MSPCSTRQIVSSSQRLGSGNHLQAVSEVWAMLPASHPSPSCHLLDSAPLRPHDIQKIRNRQNADAVIAAKPQEILVA
jgi:hypothetical protein